MTIKQLRKQLNNQKGITGADIIIAMLIIVTTLTVIGMVYVNLSINSSETNRKTGATRIITNVLENMDMVYYEELQTNLKQLSDTGIATMVESTYTIPGGANIKVFDTKIPKGYALKIALENPENQTNDDYDFVKKVTVTCIYKVDGKEKNIELSKVIEREVVRECNSPNFTEEYIQPILPLGTQFEMYSDTAIATQAGVKIICPIQYNKELKKYKIVEKTENIWYSYSNKQWAQILVLESNEIEEYIDSQNKTINNQDILKSEKSYVWIPRFGVKNGGNPFGDTVFKYKTTNYAISNQEKNNINYNYIDIDTNNSEFWSPNRGMNEEEKILGKWCSYSEITNDTTNSVAYQLNISQYGPMLQY